MSDAPTPGLYRHVHGNLYRVIGVAKWAGSGEADGLVVYEFTGEPGVLYARPVAEFTEVVVRDGRSVNRFVWESDDAPEPAPEPSDLAAYRALLNDEFGRMIDLLCLKRASYGPGNLIRFGAIGIVVRASDKIERLANMHRDGADANPDGDTAEDAWRDLIGYGVLGLLHQKGLLR